MCTITTVSPIPVVSSYDGCVRTVVRTDHGTDHFIRYSPDHSLYAVGQSLAEYRLTAATASVCPICASPLHQTPTAVHCYNFACPAQMYDVFHRQLALLGMSPPTSVAGYAPYLSIYLDDASHYGQTLRSRLCELLTFPRLIPFLGLGYLMPDPRLDHPTFTTLTFVDFARRMRDGDLFLPHAPPDFVSALAVAWQVNHQTTLRRIETICLTARA